MILLPAIDLHEGKCVRLFRGDYGTAEVVAPDPLTTALHFQEQGARWLHMVDLDGAKDGKPQNQQLISMWWRTRTSWWKWAGESVTWAPWNIIWSGASAG